jgi:hypothetical protein
MLQRRIIDLPHPDPLAHGEPQPDGLAEPRGDPDRVSDRVAQPVAICLPQPQS